MPRDVPENLDDELWCELRVGVVELGWEGRSDGSCLVDEGGAGGFAEVAERFAEDVVVKRSVGDGLGRDGDPGVGVARCLAGKDVVEGARLGVALGEGGTEIPHLSQGRDQRCVAVLLVVDRRGDRILSASAQVETCWMMSMSSSVR